MTTEVTITVSHLQTGKKVVVDVLNETTGETTLLKEITEVAPDTLAVVKTHVYDTRTLIVKEV